MEQSFHSSICNVDFANPMCWFVSCEGVKKSEKNFKDNIKEGNKEKAEASLKQTYKVLDKAAKKNVIKKGKASRKKSRLADLLNKLSKDNVKTTQKSA